MIILSVVSMNRFIKYTYYSNFSDTSGFIVDKIYQTEIHLKDLDRCERGYMLTKDTLYMNWSNRLVDSLKADIVNIDFLTDDNPPLQRQLYLFKDSVALKIPALFRNLYYVDTTKLSVLSPYFYESREITRACNRQMRKIRAEADRMRSEQIESEHTYQSKTVKTLFSLFIIFGIVTLALFFLMIKELRSRIRFQNELQIKLTDLKRSQTELEEIAYAASHDLQEPLRKIQVFSNMLLLQNNHKIDGEDKEILHRIHSSANRIQQLVADLLSLTSLTRIDQRKSEVDLNRVIHYLLIDLEQTINEKNISITTDKLPIIQGYEKQLQLLFNALIDNSIKFAKNDIPAQIKITGRLADENDLAGINPNLKYKKFLEIRVEDNGIGFDNQFIDKIFKIFQHLETSRETNKNRGIGLAICQRIIANHEGYMLAEGQPGVGATFRLFFPDMNHRKQVGTF